MRSLLTQCLTQPQTYRSHLWPHTSHSELALLQRLLREPPHADLLEVVLHVLVADLATAPDGALAVPLDTEFLVVGLAFLGEARLVAPLQ